MSTIVLYPSPGMGHLISMVELGKLITKHYPSFSIIILTLIPSFNTGNTAAYVSHVSATHPAITFHHLPDIPLDPSLYPSMEAIIFDLIRCSNSNVEHALKTISSSSNVVKAFVIDLFCTPAMSIAEKLSINVYYFFTSNIRAFVIDVFCTPAMPIAEKLNINVYYFYTSGACCLALFFYFPTIHKNTNKSFKDMNTLIHAPGLPPIPPLDMVTPLLDRTCSDYSDFLVFFEHLPKSNGIIINTFESLEPKAIKAIIDGECVPDGPTPPVYCLGPLLAAGGGDQGLHECMNWLDSHPSGSVVYLCFGSLGAFSSEQLKEIAIGLEKSGHRFLWVVRTPPSNKKEDRFVRPQEPDLDVLLPEGFVNRTKDKGLVVKTWAPQVAVLNHKSIGGFVTHCGWNSVLEAVSAGVPMVAWPLYAEQRFNKVVFVEDMKLAIPVDESDGGMVYAKEVERRVRQLMEGEEGKTLREVAKVRQKEAAMAMSGGGSSRVALAKLVALW